MRARELVSGDQEVLTPYDAVTKAARLMRGRGVAVLAVVEDRAGRKALGAVSDRQLLLECIASGHDARRCPIWNHVQKDALRLGEDQELGTPGELPFDALLDRRALLVVDSDGKLVGVVEPPAVAAALAARLSGSARTSSETGQPPS